MAITRDDIIAGYREFLASAPPDEATMLELMATYSSLATFHRRLRESAESQNLMALANQLSGNRH